MRGISTARLKKDGVSHVAGVLGLTLALSGSLLGQELGTIDFPTSARSAKAQNHFLHGVKNLHSFTFEAAEQAFRSAAQVEPGFVMAYWGQALSHNHPLLAERDIETPRAALRGLAPTRNERLTKAPTPREKGFLEAVEILFGEGGEAERAVAYSEAMGHLAMRYRDDDEVQAFYSVSLLGTVRHVDDKDFRIRMRAGAIAENIFRDNPNHPGAAHYVIHSFDDPVHAPLALTAAMRYAKIAPDSAHALHMPSHIFIQHGMWREVVRSNEASYDSAFRLWQKRDTLSDTQRYYNDVYVWHPLDWGQYGDLQLGNYSKAKKAIELLKPTVAKSKVPSSTEWIGEMVARYIIESEKWEQIPVTEDSTSDEILANGMSAARTGNLAAAKKAESQLKTRYDHKKSSDGEKRTRPLAIMHKEVAALVRLAQGRGGDAVELMETAIAVAESMDAPSGAATPLKPAHELFGEILLELGRAEEAFAQFQTSLLRTPNRTLSLRGLARAATKTGNVETARASYEKLLEILDGHPDLPSCQEAKAFIGDRE